MIPSKSYLADLGQHVLNTPDLTLAAETVFTAELKLLVQTFLFEGTADSTVGLSVYKIFCNKQMAVRNQE